MLIDIYRSGVNARRFVAVPTGHLPTFANIQNEAGLQDLQLFLQGTDLVSANYFTGLDAEGVVQQVADHGFAVFDATAR